MTVRYRPVLAGAVALAALAALLAGLGSGPAAAQEHCGGQYVVEPGDTLTAVAERCDSTVAALVRANAQISDPDVILAGWRLTIPEAIVEAPDQDAPGPGDLTEAPAAAPVPPPSEEPPSSDEPPTSDEPLPSDEPGLVRLAGRVEEGPECPVLRTPDGEIYSLVGDMQFPTGARVEITGRPVAMSFCMRGTTVEVTSLREAPASEDQ